MRYVSFAAVALLGMGALQALAQAPSGLDPATGARPGHEPGVGVSLPLSNNASNIGPADTQSIIAPTLPAPSVGDNCDDARLPAGRPCLARRRAHRAGAAVAGDGGDAGARSLGATGPDQCAE